MGFSEKFAYTIFINSFIRFYTIRM